VDATQASKDGSFSDQRYASHLPPRLHKPLPGRMVSSIYRDIDLKFQHFTVLSNYYSCPIFLSLIIFYPSHSAVSPELPFKN
jgi:hypothetical protein